MVAPFATLHSLCDGAAKESKVIARPCQCQCHASHACLNSVCALHAGSPLVGDALCGEVLVRKEGHERGAAHGVAWNGVAWRNRRRGGRRPGGRHAHTHA